MILPLWVDGSLKMSFKTAFEGVINVYFFKVWTVIDWSWKFVLEEKASESQRVGLLKALWLQGMRIWTRQSSKVQILRLLPWVEAGVKLHIAQHIYSLCSLLKWPSWSTLIGHHGHYWSLILQDGYYHLTDFSIQLVYLTTRQLNTVPHWCWCLWQESNICDT